MLKIRARLKMILKIGLIISPEIEREGCCGTVQCVYISLMADMLGWPSQSHPQSPGQQPSVVKKCHFSQVFTKMYIDLLLYIFHK